MTRTIPQNNELIKNLAELLAAHRVLFGQARVYERVVLGLNERDWSAWYRLFSQERFDEEAAAEVMVALTKSMQ
jgi:hypothetical protein